MATEEKSRDAFDPAKRYAAVGMQLGRVLVDDDFNEAERIHLEDQRRENLDVIGPVGTPDDGFLVGNGHLTGAGIDFDLGAGTLYLGGLRLWNPEVVSFSLQPDWLNQPVRPGLVAGRVDLVFIEAWQQPVTAVEDRELFEVALGGPDTSTRLRTMWRVHVAPTAGDDCPTAWADLVADLETQGGGVIDATGERRVDATLAVDYLPGVSGDLCSPAIAGGYLGAENQTIRVQLVDPRSNTLTWGFDNGAPTYRVTVGGDRRTITFEVDPRDEAHWPTSGQVVEILPWSAKLANGELLAEETGFLAKVATGFDPVFHTIVLDASTQVPAGFGTAWTGRSDAGSLGTPYFYLRVWNRGDDHASPPAIPYTPGAPLTLGSTGIQVTITGDHRIKGDHWIIAARPKTFDQVVPWALEDGRLVHGTRRFFAPLALVRWKANGSFDLLHDCRPFFLPLTRLRGCCTHTVGDEVSSFGRFTSIQQAIDALPAEGGKVCLLPGEYDETVVLVNRANVTIEGCGRRTRWRPAEGAPWTLLAIGGHDLIVRDLAIDAGRAFGIVLWDAAKPGTGPASMLDAAWSGFETRQARTRLEDLHIEVVGRSAIAATGGVDLVIRGCEILAGPLAEVIAPGSELGRWPSILSFADDVLIEDNRVLARTEDLQLPGAMTGGGQVTYTRTALGGIQIGGGSERVIIRDNHVEGGNGDGITLGSWAWAERRKVEAGVPWGELVDTWIWWAGITITINEEGCIEIEWDPQPPDDPETEWVPVSMGPVHDVAILDNRIRRMGRSGVGVARFFDLSEVDEIIAVRGLLLRGNRIDECLRLPIPSIPAAQRDHAAAAVICLAEVSDLRVRENDLIGNGKRHVDPVCGIFALVSQGVIVEQNRIIDNAPRDNESNEPARPGWRGGVVLLRALPPEVEVMVALPTNADPRVLRQNGEPSVRLADNVIVVPDGRPILVLGSGPMVFCDNHLVTRGVGTADFAQILAGGQAALAAALQTNALSTLFDLMGGVAGLVVDLGVSNELIWLQLLFYLSIRDQDLAPGPGLDPRPPIAASGQIAFHGNQVNVDLLAGPNNLITTAVALFSLDDVVVADNQFEIDRGLDPIAFTLVPVALSTRVQGNRVKEASAPTPAFATGASIYSIGVFMNDTTGNQTTRCIVGMGIQRELVPNQVFLQIFNSDLCNDVQGMAQEVEDQKLVGPSQRFNPRYTPEQPVQPEVGPALVDLNRRRPSDEHAQPQPVAPSHPELVHPTPNVADEIAIRHVIIEVREKHGPEAAEKLMRRIENLRRQGQDVDAEAVQKLARSLGYNV